jgi:hypothetical protein
MILVLIGRLRLTFRDEGASIVDLIIIAALPLLSLILFTINLSWVLLAVFLLLMAAILWISEQKSERRNLWRIITLLLYTIGIGLLSSPLIQLNLNALPSNTIQFFDHVFMPEYELSLEFVFQDKLSQNMH